MARQVSMNSNRVTLDLGKAKKRAVKLCKETGARSIVELILCALSTYEQLIKMSKSREGQLVFKRTNGEESLVIIIGKCERWR